MEREFCETSSDEDVESDCKYEDETSESRRCKLSKSYKSSGKDHNTKFLEGLESECKTSGAFRPTAEGDSTAKRPSAAVVSLRTGYNQTYIIKSSPGRVRRVFFRCGRWSYAGEIELGCDSVSLCTVDRIIPQLQRNQNNLRYLCEAAEIESKGKDFAKCFTVFHEVVEFMGEEFASTELQTLLREAARVFPWIDGDYGHSDSACDSSSSRKKPDLNATCYFELESKGFEELEGIDIIASKTYVRGLNMITLYAMRSFYFYLLPTNTEQPLLDVRFPNLSQCMEGLQLRTYSALESPNQREHLLNRLVLWQLAPVKKPLKILDEQKKILQTESNIPNSQVKDKIAKAIGASSPFIDATGIEDGYTQTFMVHKAYEGTDHWRHGMRDVFFRFGNWCYGGTIDVLCKDSSLSLSHVPFVLPILRKQQSSLGFLCHISKVPLTLPYLNPILQFSEDVVRVRDELVKTEDKLLDVLGDMEEGWMKEKMQNWVHESAHGIFYEITLNRCPQYKDIELIASKTYLSGVVVITIYFQERFYVALQEGADEQPLLDASFPDVSAKNSGCQIMAYTQPTSDKDHSFERLFLWEASESAAIVPDPLARVSRKSTADDQSISSTTESSKDEPIRRDESLAGSYNTPAKAEAPNLDNDDESKVSAGPTGGSTKDHNNVTIRKPRSERQKNLPDKEANGNAHEPPKFVEDRAEERVAIGRQKQNERASRVALPHHIAPLQHQETNHLRDKLAKLGLGVKAPLSTVAPWDKTGKPRDDVKI